VILSAIVEKLKKRAKGDFKGRHFEPWLIVQAVTWYLRYPLSCRDVESLFAESLFAERGFDVDHSTINRWVLAYAPEIEKRLRQPAPALRLDPRRRNLCEGARRMALSLPGHRQARRSRRFFADGHA